MSLEEKLNAWTGPSSPTEQDKQERTERMIRQAVAAHPAFSDATISVYAKGSYANNTNVRADSDVDVAVECQDVFYWEEAVRNSHGYIEPYTGRWTPGLFRLELAAALRQKFPGQVDSSGDVAIEVHASTVRVDADAVPCFSYRYYLRDGSYRRGTKIFRSSSGTIVNYPAQQLENGRAKNLRTGTAFKKAVRILKRAADAMASEGYHREVPSYFVECLVYNCPNSVFSKQSWIDVTRSTLVHIWESLQGTEPEAEHMRWFEVNGYFFLFHPAQTWQRSTGREFAQAAWNYLGFDS